MLFPGSLKKADIKPQMNLAYAVVAINIFVYIFSNLFFSSWPSVNSIEQLQDKNFDVTISEMYQQTLDPIEKKRLENLSNEQIGSQAIQDHRFWARINTFPFSGDRVQIESMKNLVTKVKNEYFNSVQYQYGLSPTQTSPWAWVTYQFTHYSFFHLFGNLIFIFFIISFLEKSISAFWIGAVYILGGISGGVGFLLFSGLNNDGNLSMIGASGSLCALMAFLVIVKKNETMPWIYFFAPVPKGYGEIYLPVFLIFPIYLIADFTAVLFEPSGVSSSVAHSAHIGGTIMGLLLGGYYLVQRFLGSKTTSHGVLGDDDGLDKLF
ncbi:MAG: rhomboid family intramembrane serine protease [Pseudobdellovibrio sp.]